MSPHGLHTDTPLFLTNQHLLKALIETRRQRRTRSLRKLKQASSRGSLIVLALVLPGALLIFLALVVTMAITFGRAASSDQAESMLSTLLLATLSTCLAGCLSTSLQTLYMNSEVRFLATLPVPFRLIFFAKFGEMARGAIPGIVFGISVCFGFVLGRAEQYLFLVYALISISLLASTAVFLAAGITSLVVRLARPKQTRGLLMATSLIILVGTALAWRQLDSGNRPVIAAGSQPIAWLSLLPSGWARESLVRAISTKPLTALPYAGLQIGFLMLISAFGAASFATTFARNLERVDLRMGPPRPRPAPRLARRLLKLVPAHVLHWVKREWIIIGRDFARFSAAVLPIASISIWIISTLAWTNSSGRDAQDYFWVTHGPLLLLPWAISLGTTIFAFGTEPYSFDLVRSLPIRPATLLVGKYVSYALPITAFCVLAGFVSIILQPGSRQDATLLLALICALSAAFCAVDIGFSAAAPRFGNEHVQRSTSFFARMFSTLTGLLCALLLSVGAAFSPMGSDGLQTLFGLGSGGTGPGIWISMLVAGASVPALLLATGTRRIGVLMSRS